MYKEPIGNGDNMLYKDDIIFFEFMNFVGMLNLLTVVNTPNSAWQTAFTGGYYATPVI